MLLGFEHGFFGDRMLLEYERYDDLGTDALVNMLLEHNQYFGFGMDAVVTVCFWNPKGPCRYTGYTWALK